MNIKLLFFSISFIIFSGAAFAQKSYLESEKHAPCELFAQKSGYDWQQRLAQIDSLQGAEVTVFEVKGKDNQIKRSYTGKVTIVGRKSARPRDKGDATLITVVTDLGNGKKAAYFPLTNDKNYRIYLKSCMK